MNNAFFSQYQPVSAPAREQNLFISQSRHLYLLRDGSLKYQQKELDHRTAGSRTLLIRYVLLDVDSGTVYGEFHEAGADKDLLGFLARAWHIKVDHPMRGLPKQLNVPAAVSRDQALMDDIGRVSSWGQIAIGELPSGFSAGVHAVKQFERAVEGLSWRVPEHKAVDLYMVQALSALLSAEASNSMSGLWKERWLALSGPSDEFMKNVDAAYQEPGAWRKQEPFSIALFGIPKPDPNRPVR